MVLMLGLLAAGAGACRGAEAPSAAKVQAVTTNTPKALSKVFGAADDASPEHLLLTLTAQPATSQAVSWRTRPTTNRLRAEILRAPAGPIDEKMAASVPAIVEPVIYGGGQTMLHAAVEFTNLQPATLYAYRAGDGKAWSEWNQFRTAEAQPQPFRFLYIGDLQSGIRAHGSRVLRAAVLTAPDARFIVHAGDLVTDPLNDQLWFEWYAAAGWIYRMIPSFPTPGNHDLGNKATDKTWRPQFALPRNGPPGQEELSFYTDYQGVRLVSLNGNAYDDAAQLKWLESVLRVAPDTWKIVVMHQPVYSTGQKRDSSARRKILMPIFDQCGVDLVLQGHDHTYGRTGKIRAEQTVSPAAPGVVYATSVSGSKMYKLNPTNRVFMARLAANVQLFQVLSVSRDALGYEACTADRELFDAFELRRNGSNPTTLIDRAPKDANPREEDFYFHKK
jgi:3',5'-cyclic AMP phosphodiesterase CpdA